MISMVQIAITAVQAAPLIFTRYSFMAIIAFKFIYVLRVVGIHDLTGGKLLFGLCAHKYAYICPRSDIYSAAWGSQIFPLSRGQSL